jgi:aspartate 1-decarboxylase
MPFIGNKPSAVPLTSADIADGIITSAKIVDGTIVNADINASAGLVLTKLATTGTLTVDNIQFPATQVASANANNLDDYEEGTWTPAYVFAGGNGTASFTLNAAVYTKIGNIVIINFYVFFNKGTASGNFSVTGIPFTNPSNSPCAMIWDGGGVASNVVVSEITGTQINFLTVPQSTTYASLLNASQMNASPYVRLTCTYKI